MNIFLLECPKSISEYFIVIKEYKKKWDITFDKAKRNVFFDTYFHDLDKKIKCIFKNLQQTID